MNCNAGTRLLISRYADGETRGEETARAAKHLESCASCRRLVAEWQDQRGVFAWAHTRALPEGGDVMAMVHSHTNRSPTAVPRRPRIAPPSRPARRWAWAAAAALAAVVVAGLSYQASLPPMLAHAATGREAPTVRLASGARLELGPDTEVTRLGEREVRLDRGWLRASVNSGPITVHTRRMEVRDIGTRFQVSTGQKADTVFVEAGAVEVRRGGARATVARDQLLTAEDDANLDPAGFPAWTKEEDEPGQRPAPDTPFAPDSAEGLAWQAGLRALATRYPDLRTAGGSGGSSYTEDGREYAVRFQTLSGVRAGLRAHLPGLAAWMAGDGSHLGAWSVPVAALSLPGSSADGTVPAGTYLLRLLAKGGDLAWTLEQGGNAIVIPASRAPEIRSGSFTESPTGRAAVGIEDGGRHALMVQLLDWPGALKPTLRLPLAGRSVAEARADLAPRLTALQTATSGVNGFEARTESSSVYYLDPARKHYLLWAENRAGGTGGRYLARGSSWLVAALRSNLAWETPRLAPGTYLLWLVWPAREARPHWEMRTVDGARRWMLPVSRRLATEPASARKGRLPDGATMGVTRSAGSKEGGVFAFELGFHATPSPGLQGGGTMCLAAP